MNIPPKVKHFLWRLCRDVLLIRSNLRYRHVDVEDQCPWCSSFTKSTLHLFIFCIKARACWTSLSIFQVLSDFASTRANFGAVFFAICRALREREAWCMTLWSLWQSCNDRIWENKVVDVTSMVWVGHMLLQ